MANIRDNPGDGRDLMRLNKSWIFFAELMGDGPLGVPVWLEMDRAEAGGPWIAQDTDGAIKGATGSTPSGARTRMRAALPAA